MTDNEIKRAKEYFQYGINHDIFKDPVLSYAKTVLWAFEEINRQKAEIDGLEQMLDCSVSSERNAVDGIPYKCIEEIKVFAEKVDYLIGTTPSVPNRAYRKLSAGIKKLVKELVGDGSVEK
ncbi:MAG: hypothetical protein IKA95_06615 [Clostridia bacterium]|nr:hypothetical protein [Clostridia bacterium]